MLVEELFDARAIGQRQAVGRRGRADRGGRDFVQDGRLVERHLAGSGGFDHEQPAMQRVATPVLDRGGEHVEQRPGCSRCRSKNTAPRRRWSSTRARKSVRTASNSGWPGVTHSSVGSVGSRALSKTILPYSRPSRPKRDSCRSPMGSRLRGTLPTR